MDHPVVDLVYFITQSLVLQGCIKKSLRGLLSGPSSPSATRSPWTSRPPGSGRCGCRTSPSCRRTATNRRRSTSAPSSSTSRWRSSSTSSQRTRTTSGPRRGFLRYVYYAGLSRWSLFHQISQLQKGKLQECSDNRIL